MEAPRRSPARFATVAGAIVICAAVLTGCGGSSDNSPPTTQTQTRTQGQPGGGGAAQAAIERAFVDFFAGSTSAAEKVALVQSGSAFADVINRQAGTSIAKGTTATVSKVVMLSATQANVVYTVSLSGAPALKNVTGLAVKEGGAWKVSSQTFCTLLKLEQQAPPICKQL